MKHLRAFSTWSIVLIIAALFVGAGTALAAKKVIFFTAAKTPTAGEAADIAQLRAAAVTNFTVEVVNGAKVTRARQAGTADYVAGTIPAGYRDGGIDGATLYPVLDPDNPPRPETLPSNQAMLYNGQTVTTAGGGSLHVHVAGGVVTLATCVAPDAGS